ncbi:conserved hypothetical protein [Tenacibaculum sp. 190524A02b]|uniref:Uncharacterized protein n=1 Tax=Tenacibaculum vairaonense TaxID=3137860 RepID=A0ABM9PQV5_9FLAO
MWYNFDLIKLGVLLLPTRNRKPKMIAFVKVLLAPIVNTYSKFLKSRKDDAFKLNHNWQVCYLRKALNDKLDPLKRRIEILDGNRFIPHHIYTAVEEKPKFLGTLFLYSRNDYEDTGVDFLVRVPKEIYTDDKIYELHKWVDYFKKGVKKYGIETF